jgi:site-specific DNA-methyltransferase (adenine-specific)
MERIITIFSNENDLVLDCFAGSGSTGVASKNLNRNFIIIEKDENYHSIIIDRLKENTI